MRYPLLILECYTKAQADVVFATKSQLSEPGLSTVHWDNITDVPSVVIDNGDANGNMIIDGGNSAANQTATIDGGEAE